MTYQQQTNTEFKQFITDDNNNNKTLRTLKNLTLANAILCVIIAIPVFGMVLSFMLQIPMIAVAIIAILSIIRAKKVQSTILGSIMALIASAVSFLSGLFFVIASMSSEDSFFSSLYFFTGLIAWILYVIATIFLFLEYNELSTTTMRPLAQNNMIPTPHPPVQAATDPFVQSNTQTTNNPFVQSDHHTMNNPFIDTETHSEK